MRWTKLRALREACGLSQGGLARRAGISQGYISQLETGDVDNPTVEVAVRIARTLRLPVSRLLREVGYKIEMRANAEPAAVSLWAQFRDLTPAKQKLVRRLIEEMA